MSGFGVAGATGWRRRRSGVGAVAAPRLGLREVLIFAGALLAYQASRALVAGDAATAVQNAWGIVHTERSLGLDVESAIQGWVLAVRGLGAALNSFYLLAHLPVTAGFFVWLHRRRDPRYRLIRNGFLAANAIALAVFVALPVAPPRVLEGGGFVDTLRTLSGVDLHGGWLSGFFNPYAAVPSMHFGYALIVGAGVAVIARTPLVRLLGAMYPAVVFLAIVGTANHFVLDAAAGALVVAMGFGLGLGAARLRVTATRRRPVRGRGMRHTGDRRVGLGD